VLSIEPWRAEEVRYNHNHVVLIDRGVYGAVSGRRFETAAEIVFIFQETTS
jgi:hypothetical protein